MLAKSSSLKSLRRRFPFLLTVPFALFVACGGAPEPSDDDDDECTPGKSIGCSCENGRRGAQTCDDFGNYGDCVCIGATGGASAGGSTALGGTASGAQGGSGVGAVFGGGGSSDGTSGASSGGT